MIKKWKEVRKRSRVVISGECVSLGRGRSKIIGGHYEFPKKHQEVNTG